MASQDLRWYVIRSKYRNELLLWQQLRSRSIEVYYPRIYRERAKLPAAGVRPYFPGYMFIHVDLDVLGRSMLQWMPGALGLVCFGGEPAYVSDGVLHGIQERVDQMSSMRSDALGGLKAGEAIEVCSGPFAGYQGIFGFQLSDQERAAVFLKFIRDQQVRVELPISQIRLSKQRRSQI
jgi:transcription antitermination factor NusG